MFSALLYPISHSLAFLLWNYSLCVNLEITGWSTGFVSLFIFILHVWINLLWKLANILIISFSHFLCIYLCTVLQPLSIYLSSVCSNEITVFESKSVAVCVRLSTSSGEKYKFRSFNFSSTCSLSSDHLMIQT